VTSICSREVAVRRTAWHNAAISIIEDNIMLRRFAALCGLAAILASNGLAQVPVPAKGAQSPLAPVAWLTGGTWVTDIKSPQDGSVTHVENHITWAPNHQAIQFVTEFNGKPHYNGFYAYDAAKAAIRFYYTAENGDLTIGTTTPDLDGKTLRQEFDIIHCSGTTDHVRSTVVRDGEDEYQFTVFVQQNGQWKQIFQITYKRKA
jgi:hypothetical protein